MTSILAYQLLANAVLIVHFLIVAFVIGGLVMVAIGNLRRWRWVNNMWFRVAHLAAIGVVAAQSWLGVDCPLTTLESWLRDQAGAAGYRDSFIEHWLREWLFYEAPWWTFVAAYTAFGLLAAAAWWRFPPRRGKPGRKGTVSALNP